MAPPDDQAPRRRLRTARPTTASGTVLAMVPPAVCALLGWLAWGGLLDGAFLGVMAWFLLRWVLVGRVLARHHQRGAALARQGDFAAALAAFRASEASWAHHPLLDRWRAPLLGTTARWPYRVLALYNQALCHSELGQRQAALDTLARLEELQPGQPQARQLRGWLAQQEPAAQPAGEWFDPEELA